MDIISIYSIALGSFFGLCLLWRVLHLLNIYTQRVFVSWLRKRLQYTLITQRPRGSGDVNVGTLLVLLAYLAGNIFCLVFRTNSKLQLTNRASSLFIINVAPIYIGARSNALLERVRLRLPEIIIVHHWMGRMALIHAAIHGVTRVTMLDTRISIPQILLLVSACILMIFSVLQIRRIAYEIFLKTHMVFALLLLGLLWFHVPKSSRLSIVMLATVSSLWVGTQVLWLAGLHSRNAGFEGSVLSKVECFPPDGRTVVLCRLEIPLRTHCDVKPGQYVYVTIPKRNFGFIQSHPYNIAWVSPNLETKGKSLHVLIECRKGFSKNVRFCSAGRASVILDGPYGSGPDLHGYDKVLFIAHGIGIASHLLAVSYLLQCHENLTARVRRICLVWVVGSEAHYSAVRKYLLQLLERDARSILNIIIFLPYKKDLGTRDITIQLAHPSRGLFETDQTFDVAWLIDKEWCAEAGNMAIAVCGHAEFEQSIRAVLRTNRNDIHLLPSEFKPDGDYAPNIAFNMQEQRAWVRRTIERHSVRFR